MPCYVDDPSPQVLPVRALLVTLLACLGASYWLVPSNSEMVERLMLDQQYENLAVILNSEIGKGSNINSALLHSLTSDQITALSQLLRLTPREQLNAIFVSNRPPVYDRIIHGLVLAGVRYIDVIKPDEAWQLVSQHTERMSGPQFLEVARLLARNALAVEQPQLAALILDRASRLNEAGAQVANDMAQAYRWSSQAKTGAIHLHDWLKGRAASLSKAELAQLRSLNIAIAMEGGEPGLAFDVCMDELKEVPAGQSPADALMERASNCAAKAARTRDFLPLLQRKVASIPESTLSIKDLHQRALHQPNSLVEYKKWAAQLAQYSDWNSEFETSFDQHCRLAITGSLESLDRCVALWDFLGCGQELAELLVELGPQPQRPHLQFVQADLLASLGRDTEARPLYEQWLAVHPDDREAHYDLASLLEDMGDEDACLTTLKQLVERHPNDVPAIKKLADNCIRAQRFDEALALYSRLREEDHDHYTLENYAMIAESMDRPEELFKAQWLTAKATNPPAAEPYLDMAETTGYLANPDEAIKAIEGGLARLPDSAAIRVALADLWMKDDQIQNAWAVLKHDSVKRSFEGVSRILDLAPDLPDPQEMRAFLGDNLEKRFNLPPSQRLDLAVLNALCGDNDHAEKLFASVPITPATSRLHALARFTIGSYEEAAGLMEKHIAMKQHVSSDDHVFLGDVYELLGREEEARNAYSASIDLIASGGPVETAHHTSSHAPLAQQP